MRLLRARRSVLFVIRRVLPAVLSVLLVVLVPLAYARPPDQTWIGGWYDNDDFDDVCLLVMAGVASVDQQPLTDAAPPAIVVAPLVALSGTDDVSSAVAATLYGRAPPAV